MLTLAQNLAEAPHNTGPGATVAMILLFAPIAVGFYSAGKLPPSKHQWAKALRVVGIAVGMTLALAATLINHP